MKRSRVKMFAMVLLAAVVLAGAVPAFADPFSFSTGNVTNFIGTASRPASTGKLETETADDFILTQTTSINQATITGLLPTAAPLSSISQVEIELYHVFPVDSTNPPSNNVPTRTNSPADVEISSATRDSGLGTLNFGSSVLTPSFTALNSVINGIHGKPNQTTGGEGSVTGEEVQITINFTTPIVLPPDHYFFRPEVLLTSGDFLWLSGERPITSGTPFTPDLQAWIRNSDLVPDWLRVGTDIVGGTSPPTFNMAFSLTGVTVPEPVTLLPLGFGLIGALGLRRRLKK